MSKKIICILVGVLSLGTTTASADCVEATGRKIFCSKYPNGGAVTGYGNIAYCGVGKCVVATGRKVYCSATPNGAAITGYGNKAKCQGGCVPGKRSACEELK